MVTKYNRNVHTGILNYDHVDLDAGAMFFSKALRERICPCCSIGLLAFEHELPTQPLKPGHIQFRWLTVEICPSCGWWHFRQDSEVSLPDDPGKVSRATWWELTHALQSEIDLRETTLPIETLQRHLVKRWEDRTLLSAQQAEDLVASLLQEHHGGHVIRVSANANSADGGIDLYLVAEGGAIRRAVQVKRRITSEAESVKEVRNFVGAMVLERVDHGVFVTTASHFTRVAQAMPAKAAGAKHKLHLDLVDGDRLLEMLRESNGEKPALLPPQVKPDQEWRDASGQIISGQDLFSGDIREWAGAALRRP